MNKLQKYLRLYFFLGKYIMVRRNRASRRKRSGGKAGHTFKNLVGTRAEVDRCENHENFPRLLDEVAKR